MPVIVDYDAGNVRSVQRACARVGLAAEISADPDVVARADKLIFPGVGSAESAVDTLKDRGLDQAICAFYETGKPLLGICLGLQILLEHTEEDGRDCLGLVDGACVRFNFRDPALKVPHIGWNELEVVQDHAMLKHVSSGDQFYYVHSYYAEVLHNEHIFGTTNYGDINFTSVLGKDNLFATQFHLEKSGELGLKLLSGLNDWDAD